MLSCLEHWLWVHSAATARPTPQFNFLKPTHSLFGFFTALCDAYSRVLMPPKELRARLDKDAADRCGQLARQQAMVPAAAVAAGGTSGGTSKYLESWCMGVSVLL